MATIKGATIRNRIYAGGAHGNLSVAHGHALLAAAAIGDVIEVLEIPIGIKFIGVRVLSESGLGSSVTATVKVGDKVLASAVNMSGANATVVKAIVPFSTVDKQKLTVTIAGAEATGDIQVIPEYVAEGY